MYNSTKIQAHQTKDIQGAILNNLGCLEDHLTFLTKEDASTHPGNIELLSAIVDLKIVKKYTEQL